MLVGVKKEYAGYVLRKRKNRFRKVSLIKRIYERILIMKNRIDLLRQANKVVQASLAPSDEEVLILKTCEENNHIEESSLSYSNISHFEILERDY